MKVRALKKQRNETNNLKETIASELIKSQNVPEENGKEDMEDMEQLLKVLELLEQKQSENERELYVHKRMFEMMIGSHGKVLKLLGFDQSEESESNKTFDESKNNSLDRKRKTEEEDTLDSLLEGLKKKGKN